MDTPKNIHEAIHAVMQEVGYVEKTRGGDLPYKYAGEAALIEALRPAMVKHGIYVSVIRIEDLHQETYTTSKDKQMMLTRLVATVRFTHAPSARTQVGTGIGLAPDIHIDVQAVGEGADPGDKSANKAMTGAYKYALRQTFCIETGDDPDKNASEERASGGVPEAHTKPVPAGLPETGGPRGQGDGLPRGQKAGGYSTPEDAEFPHCHDCGKEVRATRIAGETAARPGKPYFNCWDKDGCKHGFIIYCDEWEDVKARRKAKLAGSPSGKAESAEKPPTEKEKPLDPSYQFFGDRFATCPHCGAGMMKQPTDDTRIQDGEPWSWYCAVPECKDNQGTDWRGWAQPKGAK